MTPSIKWAIEKDEWIFDLEGVGVLNLSSCTVSGNENFLVSFNVVDIDSKTLAVIQSQHRLGVYDECNAANMAEVLLFIRDLPNKFVKETVRDELESIIAHANDRSLNSYHNYHEGD